MIRYEKLFDLLSRQGYNTTKIRQENIIGQRTLYALKNGAGGLDSKTIDKLCGLLKCQPSDIMEYIPDYGTVSSDVTFEGLFERILWCRLQEVAISEKKKQELVQHSIRVCDICKHIVADLCLSCDMELLIPAAMLHDIAKYKKNGKKRDLHNEKAADIIEKFADSFPSNIDCSEVSYIVLWHKSDFEPKRYVIESAVLRMADKLDKFNKKPDEFEDNLKSCIKSLRKIYESV